MTDFREALAAMTATPGGAGGVDSSGDLDVPGVLNVDGDTTANGPVTALSGVKLSGTDAAVNLYADAPGITGSDGGLVLWGASGLGVGTVPPGSNGLTVAGDAAAGSLGVGTDAPGFGGLAVAGVSNFDSDQYNGGMVHFKQDATGGRPSPAGQAGACVYDTTLGKPIWSDGTVWRDAAGTAV